MLYTTFIRLCDEAVKHNTPEEFIMNLGWQEWMNRAADADEITKDLSLIFELASLDFPGLRKRLDVRWRKCQQCTGFHCVPSKIGIPANEK